MDHVHAPIVRVVVCVLVVLGCFGVGQARADSKVTMYWLVLNQQSFNQPQYYRTSNALLCSDVVGLVHDTAFPGWKLVGSGTTAPVGSGKLCQFTHTRISTGETQTVNDGSSQIILWCANGSAPDTTKPSDQQCGSAPPSCSDATLVGKYVGAWVVGQGSTAPAYACIQGCQYPQGSTAVGLQTSYGMSIGKGNGQTCSGANYDSIDTTTKPSDPPSPVSCGKMGLVYGTYNGVGICAKGGEIPGTSVTKTDTSTTTKTDASGVQAPSQTTNTTTNVTNVNGVSTVTQTTTKPDGTKETTTETKDSFCSKHPDDAVCKTESQASGGDDCKVPPVCKGDAIQCAMLSQQWKTRCDNQQTNAASDLATQVLGGNDPSKNPADKENRDVRPIANSIDQTAFLGGGGLQDKVVTVSGQSITLPFSRLNQYLEWIGRLFVVLSLIGAIRIVLGGFKK